MIKLPDMGIESNQNINTVQESKKASLIEENFDFFNIDNGYPSIEFLTNKDFSEIQTIIESNYLDAPIKVKNTIEKTFKDAFDKGYSGVDIPVIRHNNHIVAFCMIDWREEAVGLNNYGKRVRFGLFNVSSDFAGQDLGNTILKRTVDHIAKDKEIIADCNAITKIGAKYIEIGFVATDFYDFNGWPSFKIFRNDNNNQEILGKNINNEDIVKNVSIGFIEKNGMSIEIFSAKEQNDLLPIFEKVFKQDKIVSRYFYDNSSSQWVVAVENRPIFMDLE